MAVREIAGISSSQAAEPSRVRTLSQPKPDFAGYLERALGEVNELQRQADQAIQRLVIEGKGDLQETLIAMEKADLSFRLMMQVRNKILEAYQEIIRMQV
jgi:flagellar hook-basal body complex protein FliE